MFFKVGINENVSIKVSHKVYYDDCQRLQRENDIFFSLLQRVSSRAIVFSQCI